VNSPTPPENAKFDVSVEPAPRSEVVEAQVDEDEKRKREAELASTYDPELAHHGKTDEEKIEKRQDEARLLLDTAIASGIVIALAESAENDTAAADVEDGAASEDDDGEQRGEDDG
jgi:hypothetical protein